MLIAIDTSSCIVSLSVQLLIDIKIVLTLKLFFYIFFIIFSLIPIVVMGIKGGYLPAIWRVCYIIAEVVPPLRVGHGMKRSQPNDFKK